MAVGVEKPGRTKVPADGEQALRPIEGGVERRKGRSRIVGQQVEVTIHGLSLSAPASYETVGVTSRV